MLVSMLVSSCGLFWDSLGVKATIHELYIPYVVSVEYPEQITVGEELNIVVHSSVSSLPGLADNPDIETGVLSRPTYAVQNVDYDRFIGLILRELPPGIRDNRGYQNPHTCSLGI